MSALGGKRTLADLSAWLRELPQGYGRYCRLMRAKPEYYRKMAEKNRKLAACTRGGEMETHLLRVAEQYENLAEEAEAKSGRTTDQAAA